MRQQTPWIRLRLSTCLSFWQGLPAEEYRQAAGYEYVTKVRRSTKGVAGPLVEAQEHHKSGLAADLPAFPREGRRRSLLKQLVNIPYLIGK